ncbi:AMP-binding protein [Lysinibacillus macroides]|uniref:AMP-binding protein n=1 Tax=Lysinibacillus macroides TaxID=33935 RepID=UPI000A560C29
MNVSTALWLNALRHPDKLAVIYGERTYSYQTLNEEVNRVANGLIEQGYRKGEKIGLFMKNSDYFIIAFYGIVRAGCVGPY